MNFLGKAAADPAVQNAIGFLNTQWKTGLRGGNFGQTSAIWVAMWAEYKGLELNLVGTASPALGASMQGKEGSDDHVVLRVYRGLTAMADHPRTRATGWGTGFISIATYYFVSIIFTLTEVPSDPRNDLATLDERLRHSITHNSYSIY